ncbi:MAG: ribosome-associated translation inhibitor RaiA [Oligoflexia bacterium]|nr:ribosome-associated translation inhibitor RaiA [Oligoflexia bacterium]
MQIDFVLKNTHTKGSDIKEFLEDKTRKIEKYFDGKLHAKWTISYEHEEHISHLHVTGNHIELFGEAKEHNLYTSIEEAIDKVERQLVKQKEILKDHHRT